MIADILDLVTAELARARAAHPGFHSGHEGYAVILEELDELWEAVRRDDSMQAGAEAIQVAAMAVRFLVDVCDLDAVQDYVRGRARRTNEGADREADPS